MRNPPEEAEPPEGRSQAEPGNEVAARGTFPGGAWERGMT
jgi:hypothetical protein